MASACAACLRRGWLLEQLNVTMSYLAGDDARLAALHELSDERLIEAVGGRRRAELRKAYRMLAIDARTGRTGVEIVCRHDERYPWALRDRPGAPRALYVLGGLGRLRELSSGPVVAIVGTRRATDYGTAMAGDLAMALAGCGITIAGPLAEGIARAAKAGALEAAGRIMTVMDGGVDVCRPASQRGLYQAALRAGCSISELPCGVRGRAWCEPRREWILAGLCRLVIVVEAGEGRRELRIARAATALDRPIGALPGRLTSEASRGAHELLAEGAHLVRGPQDVLDLLCLEHPGSPGWSGRRSDPRDVPGGIGERERSAQERLPGALGEVLARVGAGEDTLARLVCDGSDPAELMAALGELELLGLLRRGDAGRYVPRL